jgi:GNAT superfamily N-acetyltransferase
MVANPSNPVTCRLAGSPDVEFIYRSLKLLAQEEGYLAKFTQTIDTLNHALFSDEAFAECVISEFNHEPVGIMLFSVIHLNFTIYPAPCIFVHDMYVHKEYRRQGVAKELGTYLKEMARSRGCSRIDGIVPKANQGATAFYHTIEDIKVLDYIHYMRLNLH